MQPSPTWWWCMYSAGEGVGLAHSRDRAIIMQQLHRIRWMLAEIDLRSYQKKKIGAVCCCKSGRDIDSTNQWASVDEFCDRYLVGG